jgi:hypothetical protein
MSQQRFAPLQFPNTEIAPRKNPIPGVWFGIHQQLTTLMVPSPALSVPGLILPSSAN